MKIVRLENNLVAEIIPDYALPVEKWYGEEFAKLCVEAPDEVTCNWQFKDGEWSEYHPEDEKFAPTIEERISTLEAKNEALVESNQFLEDCLVEMAAIVYA